MTRNIRRLLMLLAVAGTVFVATPPKEADAAYRQYYGGWNYHGGHGYHYRSYFYKPYVSYPSYHSHYCIHYPSRPRYVYYYNRNTHQYWGRFDTEGKEGAQYSILKPEDRKGTLEEIPESAFPAPAAMPVIPDSEDGVTIEPPKDLPKGVPAG